MKLPKMNFQVFEYFFLNPPQQWYFERLVSLPLLAVLIGFYLACVLFRRSYVPMLLIALYAVYMVFYVFLFVATGINIHPRFVFAAHVWFVPILATGAYGVWVLLRLIFKTNQTMLYLVAGILILFTFNPRQVLLSTFFQGELMPITALVHGDMGMVNSYLLDNAREDDTLIGSLYADYVQWQGSPVFDSVYQYSLTVLRKEEQDGFSYITSVIEKHPSGWIVMDEQALDFAPPSLPKNTVIFQEKTLEYVVQFQTQHVWYWRVK